MSSKLCFNCFEKNDKDALTCGSCGVKLFSENKEELSTHPVDVIKRANDRGLSHKRDSFIAKNKEKELYRIALITSFLGSLQIYTSGILDSINAIVPVFDFDTVVDGIYLTISGFLYFAGIIPLYLGYKKVRRFYLAGNIVHLYILYKVYGALFIIRHYLDSEDVFDLPNEIQLFLNNIDLFRFLMLIFGFFYVLHTGLLYKKEFLNIRYR